MKSYGYFTDKSYVITDRNTPRHWYNYLYNGIYYLCVAGGCFYTRFNKPMILSEVRYLLFTVPLLKKSYNSTIVGGVLV